MRPKWVICQGQCASVSPICFRATDRCPWLLNNEGFHDCHIWWPVHPDSYSSRRLERHLLSSRHLNTSPLRFHVQSVGCQRVFRWRWFGHSFHTLGEILGGLEGRGWLLAAAHQSSFFAREIGR